MPKRPSTYASDDGFVEEDTNNTKRAKTSSSSAAKKAIEGKAPISTSTQTDENGDAYWELSAGGTRRATVNNFKGTWMVNLREYYEKDGKKLPGKKGISLPMDQFAALLEVLPQIEGVLGDAGVQIPRPAYGEESTQGNGTTDKVMEDAAKARKLNHEATSDEDEEE